MNLSNELSLPSFYQRENLKKIRPVSYREIAPIAEDFAKQHNIQPASQDTYRIALLGIDQQLTFCHPDFELFVAGRSGTGALDDIQRTCEFIYRNLGVITKLIFTLDTHNTYQIFFPSVLIDSQGNHPDPNVPTIVTHEDVKKKLWRIDPEAVYALTNHTDMVDKLQGYLEYYTAQLEANGRFSLTIWPYHSMLGGIGHALMPSLEEARFFHSLTRKSQAHLEIKGSNTLTEFYSVYQPEVATTPDGESISGKNTKFLELLLQYDLIIACGEAASHCFAWTIEDILKDIKSENPSLASKFYILSDCISPVVVPGVADYTDSATAALERFAEAGMHIVKSTTPIREWPGVK